jgi:hypothetical protein
MESAAHAMGGGSAQETTGPDVEYLLSLLPHGIGLQIEQRHRTVSVLAYIRGAPKDSAIPSQWDSVGDDLIEAIEKVIVGMLSTLSREAMEPAFVAKKNGEDTTETSGESQKTNDAGDAMPRARCIATKKNGNRCRVKRWMAKGEDTTAWTCHIHLEAIRERKDALDWENRYHELMADRGFDGPSDSVACFKASQAVEKIIEREKAKARG